MSKAEGQIFIVSAPSGGGKTSLTRALIPYLKGQGIAAEISVSYTTRAPRPGEQEGIHYHFLAEPEFLAMAQRGEFLEHAEVFGKRYGSGRARSEQRIAQGCDLIFDIDWQGARQIRAQRSEAIGIFILPPSLHELQRRLGGRGQDSADVIARRMAQAQAEMSHYDEYDYLIVNEDFEQALRELAAIVLSAHCRLPAQSRRHEALIRQLLAK